MNKLLIRYYQPLFYGFLGLIATFSYALGTQSAQCRGEEPVRLICSPEILEEFQIPTEALSASAVPLSKPEKGKYVGSKNGTKYYTPGCKALNRIKPENYRWFQSAEDATLQGYSQGSC
jgi:hypothetical protein